MLALPGFVDSGVRYAMTASAKFETTITCPTCSQSGRLQWKEGSGGGRERGGTRTYISVSDGFHREDGRMPSGDPVIVCNVCDEIQPD